MTSDEIKQYVSRLRDVKADIDDIIAEIEKDLDVKIERHNISYVQDAKDLGLDCIDYVGKGGDA